MDLTAFELGPNQPMIEIGGWCYRIVWKRGAVQIGEMTFEHRGGFELLAAALRRIHLQGISMRRLGEGVRERCGEPEPRTPKSSRVIHLATELKSIKQTTRGSGYSSRFSDGESPGWHNVVRAYESAMDDRGNK